MKRVFIFGVLLVSIGLAVFFTRANFSEALDGRGAANFNSDFIKGKAIELAQFKPDEAPVEPEIVYLFPGEAGKEVFSDNTKRIVDIFDPKFGAGGIQAVFLAPEYKINDAGRERLIKSFKRGVEGILSEAGIDLAKGDRVDPSLAAEPAAGQEIKITRIVESEVEKQESLPYQTKEIDDPNLERGKTEISDGKVGKKVTTFKVRRENGVEVSRIQISSEIVAKPQDKIIKRGTKIVVLSSLSGRASWTKGATAMRNYKKGTLIRVTNRANGKSVETKVGGRGPQEETGRILDLEKGVFAKIADLDQGTADVLVEEIKQ